MASVLWNIAEGKTYDSEYDGRMYTYCAYCDTCQDDGEAHDADCDMLQARNELGCQWTDKLQREQNAIVEEQQRIRQDLLNKEKIRLAEIEQKRLSQICCIKCKKRVSSNEGALERHLLESTKCNGHHIEQPNANVFTTTSIGLICWCGCSYTAKTADLKRGWGYSCSKSHAAIKRDYGRPNPIRQDTGVRIHN